MGKSYSKIRHIQNSNLILEQRYLSEEESSQNAQMGVLKLGTELGEPIDPEMATEALNCSMDEIEPDNKQKPEALVAFKQIKEKIKEKILSKDRDSLKNAFKDLKEKLKSNKGDETEEMSSEMSEQTGAGLVVATTVLGVTAPLWVWIAIGGLVLFLLLKGIIALTSWIPKTSGHGCRKTKTFRVR